MSLLHFSAQLQPGSFDAKDGVFRGVSIITAGVAKGHGMQIDATTILQVKTAAARFSKGVPVKADHWTGVGQIIGRLLQLSIDANAPASKLRGDLYLLKNLAQRAYFEEILQTFTDSIGLSISARGTRETIGGIDFLRVAELCSVDLVDEPAANPDGLLSAGSGADSAGNSPAKATGEPRWKYGEPHTTHLASPGFPFGYHTDAFGVKHANLAQGEDLARQIANDVANEVFCGDADKVRVFLENWEEKALRAKLAGPESVPKGADAMKSKDQLLLAYSELPTASERAAFWAEHEDKLTGRDEKLASLSKDQLLKAYNELSDISERAAFWAENEDKLTGRDEKLASLSKDQLLKAYNELSSVSERAAFWAEHEDQLTYSSEK